MKIQIISNTIIFVTEPAEEPRGKRRKVEDEAGGKGASNNGENAGS